MTGDWRPTRPLPSGPIDIVGDVHGELDALQRLMDRLGYRADGSRPDGEDRTLVFVGDLVDRGPDSPGVVELVMGLMAAGRAACVLGNHEYNCLLDLKREGNGWYHGEAEEFSIEVDGVARTYAFDSAVATSAQRARYRAFFQRLPLALVRDDLTVVHACLPPGAPPGATVQGNLDDLHAAAKVRIQAALDHPDLRARLMADRARLRAAGWDLRRPGAENQPDVLHGFAEALLIGQNQHPIKLMTSGPEEHLPPGVPPKYLSGKWRMVRRARWWTAWTGGPVVFGHYWRLRAPVKSGGGSLFGGAGPTDWLGPAQNAFCVDFSVGRRFRERIAAGGEPTGGFQAALGAVRWDKRELWFDDRDAPLRLT